MIVGEALTAPRFTAARRTLERYDAAVRWPGVEDTAPLWPVVDVDEQERVAARGALYRPVRPDLALLARVLDGLHAMRWPD